MGAGSESRQTPAFQFIELADLLQQQKRGGVNVRRQFGDFFAEAGGDPVLSMLAWLIWVGAGEVFFIGEAFLNLLYNYTVYCSEKPLFYIPINMLSD